MTGRHRGTPEPVMRTAFSPPTPNSNIRRTVMSWQRTALALIGAAAVMARLTWDELGPAALLVLAASMGLAIWVLIEGFFRYHSTHSSPGNMRATAGGRAPMALALSVSLMALVQLVAVVV